MIFFKKPIYKEEETNEILNESLVFNREIGQFKMEIEKIKAENIMLRESLRKSENELEKIKSIIREQTDNNIFINALRGLGIIPAPEKMDIISEQNRLLDIKQQYQKATHNTYGLAMLGQNGILF